MRNANNFSDLTKSNYERVQANDMMRNAVIVAAFAYNTANRDEKLPRKPLPKPTPAAGRGTSPQ